MLRPHWTFPAPVDERTSRDLADALGLPGPVGELLVRRGIRTVERARAFLEPSLDELHDPFLMPDMDQAVARIERALGAGERIAVYGDYDVDGITATALLVRYLRWRGGCVDYHIPHRVEEGYGLSLAGLASLRDRGVGLVVSCDCGVTAVEEIHAARTWGLDVVVTDHHEAGAELPPATAILNPKRLDGDYPDPNLAAVGVAYKLCEALEKAAGRGRETLRYGLDLVALGTIADLVPLVGENRVLARHGLAVLARTRNHGLRALLQRTELDGRTPSAWEVGFVLAPRINAIGRMDAAVRAVELLLTDDRAAAAAIAETLETVNADRQATDRQVLAEALEIVERRYDPERDHAVVLAKEKWHPGVIGIVASRVVERLHRPTILIALDGNGQGRGSARSIPGFHLLDALTACREHLDGYGGHRHAAGLAIRGNAVEPFRAAFEAYARERIRPEQLVPTLTIDLVLSLSALDSELYHALGKFAPYGPGNPEPVLALDGVASRGYPRIVGENHLKLLVAQEGYTLDTIGFNLGHLLQEHDLVRGRMTVACRLRENAFLGHGTFQGRLVDVRVNEGP